MYLPACCCLPLPPVLTSAAGRLLPAVNARQVPGKKAGIRTTDVGSVTCPPGCTDGGCTDVTTGPYFACSQCKNNLLIDADTGRCACPPGTSGAANDRCADCDKGYFCLGGVYDNQNGAYTPQQTQCPLDKFSVPLTTMGKRSASRSKCGECGCCCVACYSLATPRSGSEPDLTSAAADVVAADEKNTSSLDLPVPGTCMDCMCNTAMQSSKKKDPCTCLMRRMGVD